MTALLQTALLVFLGVAGGIAVGGGLVSLLVVLDIIPRLAQLSRAWRRVYAFETAVVSGALCFTLFHFFGWTVGLGKLGGAVLGLLTGIFVGMLAGALTEVLNVFPILARRLGMTRYLIGLLMAMVLGKMAGSLFDWLWFHR